MKSKILLTLLGVCLAVSQMNARASQQIADNELKNKLQSLFKDIPIEVTDYNSDLKQVIVGSNHFFASNNGRYLFAGSVIDTQSKTDLSEVRDAKIRKDILEQQPSELFTTYPSKIKQAHQITIFTDIDCPYCRKLHASVNELNQQGISVRYVMIPRQGKGSPSYSKTLSALCSNDGAMSIDQAMRGKVLPTLTCQSKQLAGQLNLAKRLKVRSTPTIVMPNGDLQIGLRTTKEIFELLKTSGTTNIGT